jgi:hypothetical protein
MDLSDCSGVEEEEEAGKEWVLLLLPSAMSLVTHD